MAAHARLKNAFTEDEMYHNLMSWLKLKTKREKLLTSNLPRRDVNFIVYITVRNVNNS